MESPAPTQRLNSLDQFRGYTVAGMFLVNFIAAFAVGPTIPAVLKHHNTYCSYADTIMPQFFFAVGFAFRMTFGQRVAKSGSWAAYGHVFQRLLGLILVGLVVYSADIMPFNRWGTLERAGWWKAIENPLMTTWFQTLVHIAVTSLWILPVISARGWIRLLYLIGSMVLHLVLTNWFYFQFAYERGIIDGGPLGFLTWSIPTLVGTFACDWMTNDRRPIAMAKLFGWGIVLSALGYGMSCLSTLYNIPVDEAKAQGGAYSAQAASPVIPPFSKGAGREWREWFAEPPFVAPPPARPRDHYPEGVTPPTVLRQNNYWMMSQKLGTWSYLVFASGFSLLVYLLFVLLCDVLPLRVGLFRTLGTNALIGYVIHQIVERSVRRFAPSDSPEWYVWSAFAVFFAITYLFIRHLERNKIYIKL